MNCYWLLRSPSQTCHAKPKTQSTGAGRYRLIFPLVGCLPQAAWPEGLLSKVADVAGVQQIKERGALWLIVVISVRQSTIAAISGLHCRALVIGQFEHKADARLQNSKKRAERSERLMYGQSLRVSPSGYLHHRLPVLGLLIITVITPLSHPSTTKCQRTEAGEQQLLTCRCVSVMLLRSMQNTRRLADAKAENDALRDDVAAGRRRLPRQSCQSVRPKPPPPPAWIMQPPPDWQTRWTGLFHPRRLITMQKQLERTQEVY